MLLFLPGLICDARIYAAQTAALPGSRCVDGYGLATTLSEMARVALEFADEAGAEKLDVFGHSMGGRIALELYRLAPERVRRLALVSTGSHSLAPGERDSREGLKAVGHDQGFPALVDHWLEPMVAPANRARPEIYQPLRNMCLSKGQAMFDAQVDALINRAETDSLLPQIACSVLVMTGELDTWAPPAQHQALAARLPNAHLVIVPGAGHMIQAEAPYAVNSAIADWLARPIVQ